MKATFVVGFITLIFLYSLNVYASVFLPVQNRGDLTNTSTEISTYLQLDEEGLAQLRNVAITVVVYGQGTTDPPPGHHGGMPDYVQCVAQAAEGWSFDRWTASDYDVYSFFALESDVFLNSFAIIRGDKFSPHCLISAFFVKDVDASNYLIPANPLPFDETENVPIGTSFGWNYPFEPGYSEPLGFFVDVWDNNIMNEDHQCFFTPYMGEVYLIHDHQLTLDYGTTYYWRVHPVYADETEPWRGMKDDPEAVNGKPVSDQRQIFDEAGYPIFQFTTETTEVLVEINGNLLLIDAEVPITVEFEPPEPGLPFLPVDIQNYNEEIGFFIQTDWHRIAKVRISFLVSWLGNDVAGWIRRAIYEDAPWTGPFYKVIDTMELETDEEVEEPGREVYRYYISLGYIEQSLPVELSSFTAAVTASSFVQLNWIAETETGLLGYNVLRATEDNVTEAEKINSQLIGAYNSSSATQYSYVDDQVVQGDTYHYWLEYLDLALNSHFYGPISILVNYQNDEDPGQPEVLLSNRLIGAYPNPFNISTGIRFELEQEAQVTIRIYNTRGQRIRTLTEERSYAAGRHSVLWDGIDHSGNECSSGIFFISMETGGTPHMTKKMMLLK